MSPIELILQQIPNLGRIRFIDTPTGGAPLEIRKRWIGVEVVCLYRDVTGDGVVEVGTGRAVAPHLGYNMLQTQAIRALAEKAPDAAHYWNHIGYPEDEAAFFVFNAECVHELIPVMSRQEFYAATGLRSLEE